MKAFFFANHVTQVLTSSDGRRIVGNLDGLEPGNYIVAAKCDIGTNVASGYPPPPWPYGAGALTLSFGGMTDVSYVGVLPESGQNNENVAVMVAAQTTDRRNARLYFQAVYSLRMAINSVRLAALQLDELSVSEEGVSAPDPQQAADDARSMIAKAVLVEPASANLLSEFLRRTDDDD